MLISYTYEELLNVDEKFIFIDVRSPLEYDESHIPGAFNIPLFTTEERAMIGTLYKKEGKFEAIRQALGIVGPKIQKMYLEVEKYISRDSKIVIYCARGGMRSSSVASLFKSCGMPTLKLTDGYKGYRQFVGKKLPEIINEKEFIVIHGKTGSGKTKILKEVKKQNYDVLDLEKCANHRGSLLGGIGIAERRNHKMFENLVLDELMKASTNKILTEGESKRIGNIIMPNYMFDKFEKSRKILLETEIEQRVNIIIEDYIGNSDVIDESLKYDIIDKINKLRKYISNKEVDKYVEDIKNNKYEETIKNIMLNYYDKVYSTDKYNYEKVFYSNEEDVILKIIDYIE